MRKKEGNRFDIVYPYNYNKNVILITKLLIIM